MPPVSERLARVLRPPLGLEPEPEPDRKSGPSGSDCGFRLGLFAYGTLRDDRVMQALLGRVPLFEETSAPGWRAAHLLGVVLVAVLQSVHSCFTPN